MSIAVSDIIACATLAWHVYDVGFSKYQSARQEYADFGNDIRHFAEGLNSIQDAVQRAKKQAPSIKAMDWDLTSLQSIVGDFTYTTKQCEDLVLRNPKFERDGSGFVRNISWSLGLAERVRSLRTRVSFHCSKIIFVLKPLELKMYTDIQQRILLMHGDLVGRLDEIKGLLLKDIKQSTEAAKLSLPALPPVPEYLAERFRISAAEDHSIEPFPLTEGIDAVAFHFEESTRKFRSFAPLILTPEPVQYLNLMKCIWIMKQIKSNPSFEVACRDLLWKTYVRELEAKIISETERFTTGETPLQTPEPRDILRQPETSFGMWVDFGDFDPFPTLTEPDGLEQKIFEASLPNVSHSRKQDIVVFRLSETRIRLVRIVSSTIAKHKEVEGHEIDAEKVHFLPFYAFPGNAHPALSISWRATGSDQRSQALTFNNVSDILQLQQAITNFGVVYDSLGVTEVRIKGSTLMSSIKTIGKNGRVQIWTHRPPQNPLSASLSAETVVSPLTGRQDSMSSGILSQATSMGSGWARTYAVSTNPSSEMQQAGRTAFLRYPVSSQIVIFATSPNSRESTRLISIPVTEKTRLSPNNCHCNKPSKNCTTVVLKGDSKLDIRIYDTRGHDENWNLAVLRWPGHADVGENLEVMKATNFVTLDFESVQKRVEFTETFEMARQIVNHRVESYWRDRGGVRTQHVAE